MFLRKVKKAKHPLPESINLLCVGGGLNRLFGCFPHPLYGRGMSQPVCRFSSDLDQKGAVFWSKSEHETPETLEIPETLETLAMNV